MSSRVFDELYAEAAMDEECPNCHALPRQWCRRPTGETRPIPCIARMPIAPTSAERTFRTSPTPSDVEHLAAPARPTRSFSEPLHQSKAEQ